MKGPRRCIDYIMLKGVTAHELVNKVNDQLGDGWEPVGGIVIAGNGDNPDGESKYFWQAMAQFTEREPFT